jgi:cytochrome c oxidase subunit I+III
VAAAATAAGGVAGLAGPWFTGLDPRLHVYPAIVWVLAMWIAAHAALGAIMQLYALGRSVAGLMTPAHDGDVRNIAVYHHFLALSALITFVVIGFFPRLS